MNIKQSRDGHQVEAGEIPKYMYHNSKSKQLKKDEHIFLQL